MKPYTADSFNFDLWAALAKEDPAKFEQKRQELIDRHLSDMPEEKSQRMRCLQWRIDVERDRAKSPVEAAGRLYDMMWQSVSKTYDELLTLSSMLDEGAQPKKAVAPAHAATVLPFKQKTGTGD